jgi:hypothetical protein
MDASGFLKDITGIVTLIIGVAFFALLIGHANATGSLISASAGGLNTLLNTVELSSTASDTPFTGSTSTSALGSAGLSSALTQVL